LFHALPFQRRGLFWRILVLLFPKPPRLNKIRTEMMLKYQKMRRARRHRLLLPSLKILLSIRKGSVSKSLLLRVPLLRAAASEALVQEEDLELFDFMSP
jgi:hypothetical protein